MIIDVTPFCKKCMHEWYDENGEESKVCNECKWSIEQNRMTNFETLEE